MWKECPKCHGKILIKEYGQEYYCVCNNGYDIWEGSTEESAKEWHRLNKLKETLTILERNADERQRKIGGHTEERNRLISRSVRLSTDIIPEIERKLKTIEKHIIDTVLAKEVTNMNLQMD